MAVSGISANSQEHQSVATNDRIEAQSLAVAPPESALNLEVFGRRFALVRDLFVFDDLPLIETAEAGSFDRRDMDEDIFAASLRLNKSIPFLRIEPLHGTYGHNLLPMS
jgi:hypothetical protein